MWLNILESQLHGPIINTSQIIAVAVIGVYVLLDGL